MPFPSSPFLSVRLLLLGLIPDKNCVAKVAPKDTKKIYENLEYDELRPLCSQRGYVRKDSKAAVETRLNAMDVMGRKRARDTMGAMDTSEDPIEVREKRGRAGSLQSAFVSEKEDEGTSGTTHERQVERGGIPSREKCRRSFFSLGGGST